MMGNNECSVNLEHNRITRACKPCLTPVNTSRFWCTHLDWREYLLNSTSLVVSSHLSKKCSSQVNGSKPLANFFSPEFMDNALKRYMPGKCTSQQGFRLFSLKVMSWKSCTWICCTSCGKQVMSCTHGIGCAFTRGESTWSGFFWVLILL